MYSRLPRPLVSKSGFQGCFSSFDTNGELLDPVKHALVPSPLVEEGCEGKVKCVRVYTKVALLLFSDGAEYNKSLKRFELVMYFGVRYEENASALQGIWRGKH